MSKLAALLLLPAALLAQQTPPAATTAPTAPPSTGEPWRIVALPQSSLVLARDGSLVGEVGREWRTSVSLRTLPRYVGQAFVATEDKRFYQHKGVDVVGIAGALKDAVTGDARGASTITQQLVGNMHPDVVDRRDKTLGRKLREQEAALEMERHYSKEQILEGYVNTINFGHGWYGIEAAARHYFGKPAAQLQLHEVASLAALPKGPAIYDPIKYPDRNRERRNTVLALMADQKYITPQQAAQASALPVTVAPNAGMSVAAPYFVDAVKAAAERLGVRLADGGYRVTTTLDPALQRAANVALVEGAAAVEARPGYRHPTFASKAKGQTDYLQGMVVVLDARSGDVRALVGGRNYQESPFNRATNALRQPGSSFKPFVYATALAESLVTAGTIVYDTAVAYRMENGRTYTPDNADNQFLGPLTLRDALAKSRNPVAVQLWQEVGSDSVAATARRAGIATPVAPYPSSALGASAVRPLDYVAAYTAFATDGRASEARLVTRIEDRAGRVVAQPGPAAQRQALDPAVAFVMRDMMKDVVTRGTATAVRRYLPASVPAAGKTGTTNDNTDVWFLGVTPELVGGVWLGFDRPTTITPGAAGGSLAAPIWGRVMAAWYGGRAPTDWTPPPGVVQAEIDRLTGEPATDQTPPDRRYAEWFLEGTEPGAQTFDPWRLFRWGPIAQ